MTDLDAQLTVARHNVQTFDQALKLFEDADLIRVPGSPNLDGTPRGRSNPVPWDHDSGLALHVLAGLRVCHDAAMILCDVDDVDPTPWDEAPQHPGEYVTPDGRVRPGHDPRTVVPPLAWCHDRLGALDRTLATLQRADLDWSDRIAAARACALLADVVNGDSRLGEDRTLTHPRWRGWAKRVRYECQRCSNLSGRSLLCASCLSRQQPHHDGHDECVNPRKREHCRRIVANSKRKLCSSCDQARRDAERPAR